MPGPGPRILVLGSTGRVGTRLRQAWGAAGPGARPLFQSRHPGPGIDLVLDPAGAGLSGLADAMADSAPDLVLCLWGAVVQPGAAANMEDNRTLAALAYASAHRAGVPRFAALSSGVVYGTGTGVAFDEAQPLVGSSDYAVSKIEMEDALREASARPDAPALTCLRLANLVGADMLAGAAARASDAAPLRLDRFSDGGGPVRSYASTALLSRLVEALASADAAALPPVLNVADDSRGHAMQDLLEARAACGHPVPWIWQSAPETALPRHLISAERLLARFPDLADVACTTPLDLARDWVAFLEGGR